MTEPDRPAATLLATVSPSVMRRGFAVAVLGLLGILLLWLALAHPPSSAAAAMLLMAAGAGAIVLAETLRRATARSLSLTTDSLHDSSGAVLARVDEIVRVERGVFAFKPSNGFLLRLDARRPRRWVPGLWWRFGLRVGVGGVTAAAETRAMADALSAILAERHAGERR